MFELDPFTRVFATIMIIVLCVFFLLVLASWFKDFSQEFVREEDYGCQFFLLSNIRSFYEQ